MSDPLGPLNDPIGDTSEHLDAEGGDHSGADPLRPRQDQARRLVRARIGGRDLQALNRIRRTYDMDTTNAIRMAIRALDAQLHGAK